MRFGSVGGGGRYDGLVSRFRGEPVPATGFSIGVSRLQAALTLIGKLDTKPEPGPVVVTVFDRDRIADYQRMVQALRNAEYAPGKKSAPSFISAPARFGPQLKYADKRNSPCVVIQGGDEKAKGEVQVKDLIARRRACADEQGSRRLPARSRPKRSSPSPRTSWSTPCARCSRATASPGADAPPHLSPLAASNACAASSPLPACGRQSARRKLTSPRLREAIRVPQAHLSPQAGRGLLRHG